MKQSNRLLFLKYAIPCATTLLKRKKITEDVIESLKNEVKNNTAKEDSEKIFKVAFAMCKAASLEQGKEIDEKIIQDYFWFGHDAVVDERFEAMGDFDAVQCKTYPGVVQRIFGEKAIVKTILGKNGYSTDFVEGIEKGDFVVVHREFVAEIIDKKKAIEIAKKNRKAF